MAEKEKKDQKNAKELWQVVINFSAKNYAVTAVLVVLLGFLSATVLLLATGRSPLSMYMALLQTITGFDARNGNFNIRYVGEWLTISTPMILCGLSVGFALRSGLFNIGAEGQYVMGVTFAQIAAFYLPHIPFVHALLALFIASMAGALWGGMVGYLKGKYNVSEVVSTIMLNYVALYFSRWITPLALETNSYKTLSDYPKTALLSSGFLQSITNNSLLNNGFFVMILCVVCYYIIMEKSSLGFSLKATGFNPVASRFSGISTVKSSFLSMTIAGAFAALAGGIVALGSFKYGRLMAAQDGYGFTGIAVALVAGSNAVGVFFSGLLFGMLQSAQSLMQSRNIPKEISSIISGLVVVFMALSIAFQAWLVVLSKKANKGGDSK